MDNLLSDVSCEVLIVGGGISGLLTARSLCEVGVDCIFVERKDKNRESSQHLLLYEMDISLVDLMERRGMYGAQAAYLASYRSIDAFAALAEYIGVSGFRRCKSMWLAGTSCDSSLLRREYLARKDLGFDVELWDGPELTKKAAFSSPSALVSMKAAEFDAKDFMEILLKDCAALGVRIYDQGAMLSFQDTGFGIKAVTDTGRRIDAQYLILSSCYEAATFVPQAHVDASNYYEMITEPLPGMDNKIGDYVISEVEHSGINPSLSTAAYIRMTDDSRLLIGVRGEKYIGNAERDSSMASKTRSLRAKLKEFFPDLEWTPASTRVSTRCGTKDRLPSIGQLQGMDGAYFALGFEETGMSFSMLAAEVLRDLIVGKENPQMDILRMKM